MTATELSSIDQTIEIKASPERVWRALTSAQELSTWFEMIIEGEIAPEKEVWMTTTNPGYAGQRFRVWFVEMTSPRRDSRPSGVMMIPIPRGGVFQGVDGLDEARVVPGIDGITISIPCGETVVPLPRGDRYLGFIFVRARSPEEVEAALRSAHALLEVEIDRT